MNVMVKNLFRFAWLLVIMCSLLLSRHSERVLLVNATPPSSQMCEIKYDSSPNKTICNPSGDSIVSDHSQVFDFFAGVKVVASLSVCLKKLTVEHAILGSTVVSDDFSKCDSTTMVYVSNGSAIIRSKDDSYGKCLVDEMNSQIDELLALPCDYFFSYSTTQKKFTAKNGGVYCFDTRYSILTDPVFVISGSERVVFRMYTNGIINPSFVHLKCSTHRNVFIILDGPNFCFVRGNVDATIINHKNLLSLGGGTQNILQGRVWARDPGSLTFSDVIIGNASTFSPHEAVPLENYTLCSDIKSTAQSVCSGRGKCDDYNVCNCHTHYYGTNCELTTCFSIPSNSSIVCSGNGTCDQYNTCTCKEGHFGDHCQYNCIPVSTVDGLGNIVMSCEISNFFPTTNQTSNSTANSTEISLNATTKVIQDVFAGYKLITLGNILLQNVPSASLKLTASIVIGSMGPQSYLANGSAFIHLSSDSVASDLVQKAQAKFTLISSLSCQSYPSQNTNYLHIKNGGVYCFQQGWSASGTIIVEGTEPVIFKLSTNLNYGSLKITYLKCASFRNVFWIVYGSTSVSGMLEGTLIPIGSVNFNNVIVNGAVWNLVSGSSMNFNNVIFTGPTTFDPYQEIVGDICNFTMCGNVKSTNSNVCSGHGNCLSLAECTCFDGYYSSDCSITECYHVKSNVSTVCNGHGKCQSKDTCQCNENYFGSLCQYTTCFGINNTSPNVCSQHGICNSFNNCTCNSTFVGQNCELPSCNGNSSNNTIICNGRGICGDDNSCKCSSEVYFGHFCELTTCGGLQSDNETVCSKRGRCLDYNSCECSVGYYGDDCELFDCYGMSKENAQVCSGQGKCTNKDLCECQSDYFGYNCQNTMCFGILNSMERTVCSGHGNCSLYNQCICQENYSGLTCEFTTCNSINSSALTACSSHGKCVDFNNCSCENGYFGNSCQVWNCYTKSNLDPSVCSGNGNCVDLNTCECNQNSYGDNCFASKCYGVLDTDPQVCNGHGQCISPNHCNCSEGYSGEKCEMVNLKNETSANETIPSSTNQTIYGNETLNEKNSSDITANETTSQNETLNVNETIRNITDYNNTQIGNETISKNETVEKNSNETLSHNETLNTNETIGNVTDLNNTHIGNETNSNTNETVHSNETTSVVNETRISNESTVVENGTNTVNNETIYSNETVSNSTVVNVNETLSGNETISNNTQLLNETISTNETMSNNTQTIVNETLASNSTMNQTNPENITETLNTTSLHNETALNNTHSNNQTTPIHPSYCDPILNCSNHGVCTENSTCKCHSDFTNGFWDGNDCSSCSSGFFGNSCSTKISGPITFTSDFRGIVFTMFLPEKYSKIDISCKMLLSIEDLQEKNLFGDVSSMKCQYLNKKMGLFMISFGSVDYALYPGLNLKINTLIFDSLMSGSVNSSFISLPVVLPTSVQSSHAIVSIVNLPNLDTYSSCDEITIDGTYSHSLDGKPLNYYWSLLESSTYHVLSTDFPNKPIIRLNSSLNAGEYLMGLVIESSFLNMNSSRSYSKAFKKSQSPLPLLYIPNELVERTTNQFPFTIRKAIRESTCQSGSSKLEWSQLSGPSIDFHIDQFNNLVISSIKSFGSFSYEFKVCAFYSENPQERVCSQVVLKTKSPELILNINLLESSENGTILQVDYSDPESLVNSKLKETWQWSCEYCTFELTNYLNQLAHEKSKLISIETKLYNIPFINLKLRIEKSDSRFVEFSLGVHLQTIPPSLVILNVEPNTQFVKQGQLIQIRVFSSLRSESTGANLRWCLNGNSIGFVQVSRESTNLISIETDQLEEDSNDSVLISLMDPSNNASTTISYNFSVYSPPKPCHCTAEPLEGFALETEFEFYCSNCRNPDENINYKYGFLDDRSGSKIYLFTSGELYASKLPSPFSGSTINCFFEIYNYETGAQTIKFINISVFHPTITDISQIQTLVQQWQDLSSFYFMTGDFSRSIYQAASTSRTDAVLLRETIALMMKNYQREIKASSLKCVHGVDISGVCKCMDGYVGPLCDISIKDFSNIQATKLQMLDNIITIINSTEGTLNDNYLSLFAFAIDSLLFNYEYLDSYTISESIYTLNMFLRYALLDFQTKLSNGVDTLLNACIDSAYKYIVEKQYLTDQISNSRQLLKALKQGSNLQAHGVMVGKLKRQNTGPFYTVLMGKNILYDFLYVVKESKSNTIVEFDSDFFEIDVKSSNLITDPFVYSIAVTSDIYSLDKTLKVSQQVAETSYRISNLVSPIVSVSLSHVPVSINQDKILYTIPLNMSTAERPLFSDLFDFTQQVITYSCGNFQDDSHDISTDCIMISKNDSFAQCRCSKLTNVFVFQSVTTTSYSAVYIIALSLVLFFVCCSCCIACLSAFSFCRSRFRRTTIVHPYSENLSIQSVDSASMAHHSGDEGMHDHSSLEKDSLIGTGRRKSLLINLPIQPVFSWKKMIPSLSTRNVDVEHTAVDLYEENGTRANSEELEDVISEDGEKNIQPKSTKSDSSSNNIRKQSINPTALNLEQVKHSLEENADTAPSVTP